MEKIDWKERLKGLAYCVEVSGGLHILQKISDEEISMRFGKKDLENFIQQELDKAREEGFNDGRKYEVMSRYNDGEFLSDKRKKEFEMLGQKYLSKLKDK
jgi:hypothetical protein